MTRHLICLALALTLAAGAYAADAGNDSKPALTHPDTTGWDALFAPDLSNALKPKKVWTFENGELTASEDKAIWSKEDYDDFTLDLEFKNAPETNSGVIVYCSNVANWIPNSIEIQIADDHAKKWADSPKSWQCGAIFGRLPASKRVVKQPGEWNHFTIQCVGKQIDVVLNGEHVTSMDMSKWTDPKTNPDGSEIPSWLSKPAATLPTQGRVGFQGKHAGAPIWFRNIKVKRLN